MGHTLVTRFAKEDHQRLQKMLAAAGAADANKIPYGRPCDRKKADQILPHHVTLFSWKKELDAKYLKALEGYRFPGTCKLLITKPKWISGEEGSTLLMLEAVPSDGFDEMIAPLEKRMQMKPRQHLHITLAVSKDHLKIRRYYDAMKKPDFPFQMTVTGLELYKIWEPVKLVRSF
ncbi:MAG: hypothetical protein K5695_14975 [Oscillospiraceae bacterium]|nr:hypothetical protein [Oscillospiraceae bacterium]